MLRKVDVGDYPLDLVPLEKDVLSLELEGLFRRVRDREYSTGGWISSISVLFFCFFVV